MNIGLDYDGTITADPTFWYDFIVRAQNHGHKVYIVTMRYESEGIDMQFAKRANGFHFTGVPPNLGRKSKQKHMLNLGIPITVWIDDNPRAVYQDANEIWPDPAPEGKPIDPALKPN